MKLLNKKMIELVSGAAYNSSPDGCIVVFPNDREQEILSPMRTVEIDFLAPNPNPF